ncbi:DUF1427 family protein [Arthrobacter sp. MI7-26]|uniref:DUF1427 family protein n=1 Tax=Arthrobacter sp. MI7-26 TaxID=2993653 RepID=UPI002248EFEC|nr:DUF1427 family protein [Arthrobacter sp. MI7-26]MCX2750447.1 DUF1427 family protein [Arthrobacter sp. MI7-26]
MELITPLVGGIIIGLVYAAMRVRSPAPPPIALLGLAGMLISYGALAWVLA